MPIVLAILSLAQGIQQAKQGDKVGGLVNMFNAGRSFGSIVNGFSVNNPSMMSDTGVRRNYL